MKYVAAGIRRVLTSGLMIAAVSLRADAQPLRVWTKSKIVTAVGYETSLAVVIGISAYSGGLEPLQFARADAIAVGKALEKQGFKVTRLLDGEATRAQIAKVLGKTLPAQLSSERRARVLIYFSGHGQTLDIARSQMGYLMPSDGVADNIAGSGVSMQEVQQWLANYSAKHVMFVADACYSGLAFGPQPQNEGAVKDGDYLDTLTGRRVRVALVAGTDHEQARETKRGGSGIFTKYFLEAIEGDADANNDGMVTAGEAAEYVKPRVFAAVRAEYPNLTQTPQDQRVGRGEFVFIPERAAGEASGDRSPQPTAQDKRLPQSPMPKAEPEPAPSPPEANTETRTTSSAPNPDLEGIWTCRYATFVFTETGRVTLRATANTTFPRWNERPYAMVGARTLEVDKVMAQLELSSNKSKMRISAAGATYDCSKGQFRASGLASTAPAVSVIEGVWTCRYATFVFTESKRVTMRATANTPFPRWVEQPYEFTSPRTMEVGTTAVQAELDDSLDKLQVSGAGVTYTCAREAFGTGTPASSPPERSQLEGLWKCRYATFLFTETGKVTMKATANTPFPRWTEQPFEFVSARTMKVGSTLTQVDLTPDTTTMRISSAGTTYTCAKQGLE